MLASEIKYYYDTHHLVLWLFIFRIIFSTHYIIKIQNFNLNHYFIKTKRSQYESHQNQSAQCQFRVTIVIVCTVPKF